MRERGRMREVGELDGQTLCHDELERVVSLATLCSTLGIF